jgi:hypothetical protein
MLNEPFLCGSGSFFLFLRTNKNEMGNLLPIYLPLTSFLQTLVTAIPPDRYSVRFPNKGLKILG